MITVPGWAWAATGTVRRFSHPRQGMTVLLDLIGGKMILAPVLHVCTVASLGVIVLIIAGTTAAGLHPSSRQSPRAAPGARPDVPGASLPGANAKRSTA